MKQAWSWYRDLGWSVEGMWPVMGEEAVCEVPIGLEKKRCFLRAKIILL